MLRPPFRLTVGSWMSDGLSGVSQSIAQPRRRSRRGGFVDSILTQTMDPVNLTGKVAAVTMVAFASTSCGSWPMRDLV